MNVNENQCRDTDERKRRIRERYKGVGPDELDFIPAREKENIRHTEAHKRVAVYARVSTDDPNQTSSYELQKNHYTDVVGGHPNWKLVDIYADEGISGTSLQHRDSFISMIHDCEAGKIDMIITKSVSRFARNIVDCIKIERDLKKLSPPVGVLFETENIYTLDEDCEVLLSIMAMMAQEESHTKSEIMNASIEMRFRRGIFLTPKLLGYDQDEDGNLVVNEDEAKIVRLIFYMYLDGYTCQEIADTLTEFGQSTKKGNTVWSPGSILQILQNERHCGDVLARKTWTPSYLDHKSKKNKQDRNQYRKRDHHEPIISRDDFLAVQQMISNARYGAKGFLPELHVIPEGVLKGFVTINPRWAGFTVDNYYDACDSISGCEDDEQQITHVRGGDFDLRGYEVARSQFFETPKCAMTISGGKITFSAEAIRKFGGTIYVELLVHPRRRILAVRPCEKDNRNSLQWSRAHNSRMIPRRISGTAFLPSLFALLGWNNGCKYRIAGRYFPGSLLIFDAEDAELMIPKSTLQSEDNAQPIGAGNTVYAFPEAWAGTFGTEYYAQDDRIPDISEGKTDISGLSFSISGLSPTGKQELRDNIESLKTELKQEISNG